MSVYAELLGLFFFYLNGMDAEIGLKEIPDERS